MQFVRTILAALLVTTVTACVDAAETPDDVQDESKFAEFYESIPQPCEVADATEFIDMMTVNGALDVEQPTPGKRVMLLLKDCESQRPTKITGQATIGQGQILFENGKVQQAIQGADGWYFDKEETTAASLFISYEPAYDHSTVPATPIAGHYTLWMMGRNYVIKRLQ